MNRVGCTFKRVKLLASFFENKYAYQHHGHRPGKAWFA